MQHIVGGQDIFALDVPCFAHANVRGRAEQHGVFAAGHIFAQEAENLLHLPAALHLGAGQLIGIGGVHAHDARGVDIPLILAHTAEDADGHALQIPVAVGAGLSHPPVEGAVVYAVLAVKVIAVRIDIGLHLGGIHMADAEEHRHRLDAAAGLVAHLAGHAAAIGNVRVARAVNHDIALYQLQPALGHDDQAGQAVFIHHRGHERAVEQHLHPGLAAHFIQHHLERFCVKGGDVVVPHHDVGGKGGACGHLAGIDGRPAGNQAIDDFLEQAADDHIVAILVIAGHKRIDLPQRRHTAQAVAAFNQQGFGAVARGRNGGAYARRAAAHHRHLRGVAFIQRTGKIVHARFLPLFIPGQTACSPPFAAHPAPDGNPAHAAAPRAWRTAPPPCPPPDP